MSDPAPGRRLERSLVAVALGMAVVGSVGAPLITSVATSTGVSLAAAQWTLTVTLFTGAIASPVLGRLGAGSRRRATVLLGISAVVVGGVLTALPWGFALLLVGRGLQGLGLGVGALLMGIARDRLPADRAASTIGTLAVASTVGIGVGYPFVGLVDQLAGLRAAYGVGLFLALAALLVAWRTLPPDTPGPSARVDVAGAALLGTGTAGVLLLVAAPGVWSAPRRGLALLVGAVVALGAWVAVELRAEAPLVDLRVVGRGPVVRANAATLVLGVAMYLLFSLLTRYAQTPASAGYGFGLSGVAAGAALIPFSVLGFAAGRLVPCSVRRAGARGTFAVGLLAVAAAAALLAVAPGTPAVLLAAMAVLGLGVGGVSAVMPQLSLVGVPVSETASVLSVSQVVRAVGFSMGSALAGALLAAATPTGALVPPEHGYVTAALWGLPLVALSALPLLARRRRPRSVRAG
ncbi:MFS transporter [Luteimicrobium xylanilyticum]|uniref:Bile acid transporter n=1 Tax=Luteimicrobium xylanilyticum TaxID=1133546 RepID=A0A5P9Q804_9MICO|nr:MFS transporter [Luteimicrobium xylanilyticum]QFU97567.1 Bile acid transporter [Luteimicrobium xylanilyticum]